MNIKIIGLGGVGTVIANSISRYLYFSKDIKNISITLIDGDTYEEKNNVRQLFHGYGNKAEIKSLELIRDFGNKISYHIFPEYVNSGNISRFINDEDIVFMAVDNHKTRKLISDHCTKLNTITLISGGNEYTDGNIQCYVRKDGINLTPTLTQYHPEIDDPEDKSPEEQSCEERSISEPQLFFMNMMIAVYMCAAFYNIIVEHKLHSDVYVDMVRMESDSKVRCV